MLCSSLLVCTMPIIAAAADERPVRIIAEAEDFEVVAGDWKVVPFGENYFASTFAITFLSRRACLGAPGQPAGDKTAVAEQKLQIATAGEYAVLARYEQPYNFSVEFTVEVEQGGKVVHSSPMGRLEDPKLWPFSKGRTAPMKWWFWGGGDNIVWQEGVERAKLAAGPATIRLIAGPQMDGAQPRVMAANRNIDVVCLTNDFVGLKKQKKPQRNYLPLDGWLLQDGDLYVRFTNPPDGKGPCIPIVRAYFQGQHSPWWVHTRDWPSIQVLRSGQVVSPTTYEYAGPHANQVKPELLAPVLDPADFKKIPDEEYLRPGQTSGWTPVGQVIDALHVSKWTPAAKYKGKVQGLDLELEFAVPDGRGGLKSVKKIRVAGKANYPTSPIMFEMPGDILANPKIDTHLEILRDLKREIEALPKNGNPPKRFLIYGIMGFSGAIGTEGELGRLSTELALALGDNTMTWMSHPHAKALGVPKRRTGQGSGHWSTIIDGAAAQRRGTKDLCDKLEADGKLEEVKLVSYGDEHYVPPARIKSQPGVQERFKAWLKESKGIEINTDRRASKEEKAKVKEMTKKHFGPYCEEQANKRFAAWIEDKGIELDLPAVVTSSPDDPLYYYSELCAHEYGFKAWGAATKYLESRSDGAILAGINYGPASHNMVDELNFVRAFKQRAVNLAWSEDYVWQMPEFSIQVTGYRTSGFRAGAKYHRNPIMLYTMPHSPGNTPRDLRLSYYTTVAHGSTMIHFYCATPSAVGITENYIVSHDREMFRTVHDLTHETGLFELYVVDGTVRQAKVGLLLSSVEDIRNPAPLVKGGHSNAGRKAIYYALRHAQVPVDFLSEDDVIDGLANDYRLIYVTQEYLHANAVKALTSWVERGGTLVALCGGGFLDEFSRPNPAAASLYGVKSQSIKKDDRYPVFQFKQDLPPYEPLDFASWDTGAKRIDKAPVVLWQQTLEAADGKVVGVYGDGKPAVIEKAHGKGKAVLFGFMAGLAYLKSGLPLRPWDRGSVNEAYDHFLPIDMDPALRRALVDDFLPADFVRPVECSETLVETTCIDTPKTNRLAVPLMNYTGTPIPELTVKLNGLAKARAVRSVVHGKLKPVFRDGAATLKFPLDVTDMLLIDR